MTLAQQMIGVLALAVMLMAGSAAVPGRFKTGAKASSSPSRPAFTRMT
ncbi:hypothetical protein PS870_03661 [Pseudomonas fluorescens]|jgi:hypothetical protein|uniref:Uncharacterized protein n=1 Tax=Pseudomonas fluorescens TaxID=294 RepID=A0A5E7LTR7_PSEFL|nr:hypothetical protein PS870_03661 [Pseudomonas fluorescens]